MLRNPREGSQLCVKRVVGLPGEAIELTGGDVWIDGRPWVKNLAQQRVLRQPVHRESAKSLRWQTDASAGWRWGEETWQLNADHGTGWRWLHYEHPGGRPITDDLEYNPQLSRRLNLVCDFALSVKLKAHGSGQLALELNDGRQTLRVTLALPEGKVSLAGDEQLLHTAALSAESLWDIQRGAVLVEFSNFDRQLLLAIGSRVELRYPLADGLLATGTSMPFAVGVAGLQVSLGELTVYRDIYYPRQAVGQAYDRSSALIRLGDDEYYLLGDNCPISIDSRSWGGVSGQLLLGKALGVR